VISKSRNVIQNGNFDVWQRGTSFAAAANTAAIADRWVYLKVSSAGVVTISQDATPPNTCSLYDLKVAVTTKDDSVAANEYSQIQQAIEGTFFQAVRGKPMVLSFWVKSYITGTFCVALISSASNETFLAEYTVLASATWEKKIVVIPPIPAGTWGTGTAIAAYLRFVFQCGSDNNGGAVGWQASGRVSTANQVNLLASTDNYWQVSQVQLEAGSSATEFEVKDPSEVLAACQRYLQIRGARAQYEVVGTGYSVSTAGGEVTIDLATEMRATPVLSYTGGGGVADFVIDAGGGGVVCNAITLSVLTSPSAVVALPSTAGTTFTIGHGIYMYGNTGNVTKNIAFSAEI